MFNFFLAPFGALVANHVFSAVFGATQAATKASQVLSPWLAAQVLLLAHPITIVKGIGKTSYAVGSALWGTFKPNSHKPSPPLMLLVRKITKGFGSQFYIFSLGENAYVELIGDRKFCLKLLNSLPKSKENMENYSLKNNLVLVDNSQAGFPPEESLFLSSLEIANSKDWLKQSGFPVFLLRIRKIGRKKIGLIVGVLVLVSITISIAIRPHMFFSVGRKVPQPVQVVHCIERPHRKVPQPVQVVHCIERPLGAGTSCGDSSQPDVSDIEGRSSYIRDIGLPRKSGTLNLASCGFATMSSGLNAAGNAVIHAVLEAVAAQASAQATGVEQLSVGQLAASAPAEAGTSAAAEAGTSAAAEAVTSAAAEAGTSAAAEAGTSAAAEAVTSAAASAAAAAASEMGQLKVGVGQLAASAPAEAGTSAGTSAAAEAGTSASARETGLDVNFLVSRVRTRLPDPQVQADEEEDLLAPEVVEVLAYWYQDFWLKAMLKTYLELPETLEILAKAKGEQKGENSKK